MQLDVITLFPEWFDWFRTQRHVRNAFMHGHELRALNPREHTPLSGGQVDDTPFGGGAGMVLRVDVMDLALRGFYGADPVDLRTQRRVIALTPGGRILDDAFVDELAAEPAITLLCGRYEGFDERIVQHFASDAVSVGRYVLSGGELAAMVILDSVIRKLPGALGHAESALEESFSAALEGDPEYPHYTRPADYRGWKVPEVLLSGHHEEIRRWRRARSRERGAVGPTARPPDPESTARSAPAGGADPFGPMEAGAGGGGADPFGAIDDASTGEGAGTPGTPGARSGPEGE